MRVAHSSPHTCASANATGDSSPTHGGRALDYYLLPLHLSMLESGQEAGTAELNVSTFIKLVTKGRGVKTEPVLQRR